MKKSLLLLSFLFSSILVAQNGLSKITLSDTVSDYQKIVQKSILIIDRDYVTLSSKEDNVTINDEEDNHFISYKEAVAQAKKEDKMILLEVVINNCKFCKKMKDKVLSKESVQEVIAKNFIFTRINADREPIPLGLSEQMSPMFVFISKSENVEDMRFGYIEESDFLNLLEKESKK